MARSGSSAAFALDRSEALGQPEAPVSVVPRATVTTMERPVPMGEDPTALRQTLASVANASGVSQREISRRMGTKGNTINQFLQGRAMTKPSFAWVSRFVFACGGRVWVEYPKR